MYGVTRFETVQKGYTLSIDYQVRVINSGKEEQGLRQYRKDIHLVLIITGEEVWFTLSV